MDDYMLSEEEASQWADAIARVIKGEDVIYLYRTWESARHDFEVVCDIAREIGLWHETECRQGLAEIRVNGCITFTTLGFERRRS